MTVPRSPGRRGASSTPLTFIGILLLLFCALLLLLSLSQFNRVKLDKASDSLRSAFGLRRLQPVTVLSSSGSVKGGVEFQQEVGLVRLKEQMEGLLAGLVDQGGVELAETEQGFLMRFDNRVLFEPGRFILRDEIKAPLQQLAHLLVGMPNLVRVVGHTDDQLPASDAPFKDNWSLSAVYAAIVVQFLTTEGDLVPRRLEVRGMGQYAPQADNETEAGRAKNRRTEIIVSRETLATVGLHPAERGAMVRPVQPLVVSPVAKP